MFGIHEGFLEYLERASKGERVIWQVNMRLLHCFSGHFCGDHNRLVFSHYTGMFELGFELDGDGHYNEDCPVAIVFWCAGAQLVKHAHLLKTYFLSDRSLPVKALLDDAIRYLKVTHVPKAKWQEAAHLANELLSREEIVVPWSEITKIVGHETLH